MSLQVKYVLLAIKDSQWPDISLTVVSALGHPRKNLNQV